MVRADNDSWGPASSVGVTATVVALQRAVATRHPQPLINDPYAECLVAAVGVEAFTGFARGELSSSAHRMADGIAARTKYFDDFLIRAGEADIRQVVILASGLDARAYRLAWPDGATVYELDQPQVIELKTEILTNLGVAPSAQHHPIAVDLRDDWPAALRDKGFDPTRPTAWIAEGLLIYLPPEAQDRLLDNVTTLSVPGSRFAAENTGTVSAEDLAKIAERMKDARQSWRNEGLDGFAEAADIDITELFYAGERTEAAKYLEGRGWAVELSKNSDLHTDYGLEPPSEQSSSFADMTYLTAMLV